MVAINRSSTHEFCTCLETVNGTEILSLYDRGAGNRLQILPSLGGTVVTLQLCGGGSVRSVLAFNPDEPRRDNHGYRGRLLFPFCCRIPQGSYSFQGALYRFPINRPEEDSALHGFLYDEPMQVDEITCEAEFAQVELSFPATRTSRAAYPFSVSFKAAYTLRAGMFELELAAANEGSRDAPIAFGWHPYFVAAPGSTLYSAGKSYIEVDASIIPTGAVRATQDTRFNFSKGTKLGDIPQLDEALSVACDGITELRSDGESIVIEQDPQVFRYVQFYLPPDRQSIAIEPITSPANSFNHPEFGLHIVKPGEKLSGTIRIRLG